DAPFPHRPGQRAVLPVGTVRSDQMTPHQIGRGQVVVTGDGVHRTPQLLRHIAHKTGLATAGGPLDQHRQTVVGCRSEKFNLVANRLIKSHWTSSSEICCWGPAKPSTHSGKITKSWRSSAR